MSTKENAQKTDLAKLTEEVRAMMLAARAEQAWSWEKFAKNINEIINQSSPPFKYLKARVSSTWIGYHESEGVTFGPEYWKELKGVLSRFIPMQAIEGPKNAEVGDEESIGQTNNATTYETTPTNISYMETYSKSLGNFVRKQVAFGVFKFQDTILPLFFEYAYKMILDVKWYPSENWSDGLKALKNKDVKVILHDFSTVLAYNISYPEGPKLIFFPYFSFEGYSVVVKKEHLEKFISDNKLAEQTFKKFEDKDKIKFLQEAYVILEKGTDFEWVYKDFCRERIGFTIEDEKIGDYNTNEGKKIFNGDIDVSQMGDCKDYSVYCTNSVHLYDLLHNPKNKGKYVVIATETNVTDHANFNGLICTEAYYADKETGQIVEHLNNIWFMAIKVLNDDISKAGKHNGTDDISSPHYHTVEMLIKYLEENTNSKISKEKLGEVFEGSNTFYYDKPQAFLAFYEHQLNNVKMRANYCGIIQKQIEKQKGEKVEITLQQVETAVRELKETMAKYI